MALYDRVDLDFTWDGDFFVGSDGDLADTNDDHIRSLETEIRTVVKSEFDDWQLHPQLGANLSEYRGEPNTREIGENMQTRIRTRLVSTGIINPEDISVRVVPVGVHRVLVVITISASASPNNRLTVGEPLVVSVAYDSLEDTVFFFEDSETEKNFRRAL